MSTKYAVIDAVTVALYHDTWWDLWSEEKLTQRQVARDDDPDRSVDELDTTGIKLARKSKEKSRNVDLGWTHIADFEVVNFITLLQGFRRFLGLRMSDECDAKRDAKTAYDDAEMSEMMYKSATQLHRVVMQKITERR